MKTTIIFLFISITALSQSKKELRAEIDLLKSQQAQVNLAHQIQVSQLIKNVDSLKTEIVRQNKQSQNDRDTIVYLQGELDNSNDSLTQLTNLLAKIQPKKKKRKRSQHPQKIVRIIIFHPLSRIILLNLVELLKVAPTQ